MAAKFRKIDPRIWNDESFATLAAEPKILVFWLLTSSRVNRCGVVAWSPGLCSEETGIPRDRVDTVLDTVSRALNWPVDTAARLVLLPKWWKYNPPPNADALKGALADLDDLPRNDLKEELIRAKAYIKPELRRLYDTVIATVYGTVGDTVGDTVSDKEKEKENEKERESGARATSVERVLFDAAAKLVKIDLDNEKEVERLGRLVVKMEAAGITAELLAEFPAVVGRYWKSLRSIDLNILEQKWRWLVEPPTQPTRGGGEDGSPSAGSMDQPGARKLRTSTVSA